MEILVGWFHFIFLPRFQVHRKKSPSQYQEKKLHGAHSVHFNTPVQKADLGIRMTFNGLGKNKNKSNCLALTLLQRFNLSILLSPSHSACCMQNQHSSSIVQEKHIPFGVGRSQGMQVAVSGEPDSSGVLDGHFAISRFPPPPSEE